MNAGSQFPHIVSTPDVLGGAWRIDGHRVSTNTLSTSTGNCQHRATRLIATSPYALRSARTLTPSQTRVLHGLMTVLLRDGIATHSAIAREVGITVGTLNTHLRHLRKMGLVTWEFGKLGTLRPGTIA